MATSKKTLHENLRNKYLDRIMEFFRVNGEEVLRTGTNEFAFPCIDEENNDEFIVVTVKVPTGSRDGEPYDGYSMADDFKMKLESKAEKAKENAEKKAKKIAKDKAAREAKAKAKADREKGE